jgi:hypothetical protein
MKLDNLDLMKGFYEEEKHKYPDVSFEQFKEICFGPWRFLKHEMESGRLPEVRLKYFGTFQVYKGRAKNMLINLEKRYVEGKVKEREYLRLKEMITKYLNNIEE